MKVPQNPFTYFTGLTTQARGTVPLMGLEVQDDPTVIEAVEYLDDGSERLTLRLDGPDSTFLEDLVERVYAELDERQAKAT
ncbi:MAG: hypothetical protein NVS3B24_21330 [Candidatus Dormibacteria bacterium]